jgi:hypothetical protein
MRKQYISQAYKLFILRKTVAVLFKRVKNRTVPITLFKKVSCGIIDAVKIGVEILFVYLRPD